MKISPLLLVSSLIALLAGCGGPEEVSAGAPPSEAGGAAAATPGAATAGLPVQQAAQPGPPVSGGTLAVADWNGAQVAVASDPDGDRVWMVNLQSAQVIASTALTPGDEPGRVVVDSAGGRAFVVLRRAGQVAILDSSGQLLSRSAVCAAPRGIARDAASQTLTVACLGGELVTLPDVGGAPTRVLQLDHDLRDVVLDAASGLTLVSRFRSAEVLILNPDGSLSERVQPGAFSESGTSFVPEVAWRMAALPGGGAVVIHQRGSTANINISSPGGYSGGASCAQSIVHSALSTVSGGEVQSSLPVSGTLPVDVAVDPQSATIALAFASSPAQRLPGVPSGGSSSDSQNTQPVLPPCSFDGDSAPTPQPIQFGSAAPATPLDPDGLQLVSQPASGQPVAVAFSSSSVLVQQTRLPLALQWQNQQVVLDPQAGKLDSGDALFHLDSGGGLACSSCHPEGGDDGRVWKFDTTGLRRTMNLRGGMLGTGPFHWNGSLPDFPALVNEVFVRRMSGPQPSVDQMTLLKRYLDAMPSPASSPPADPDAVARGATLFASDQTGCTSCHAGDRYSNNSVVDVGTGDGPLKVPVLRGVGYRDPYLHNGCAATLADRFGPCGGDRHGNTDDLSTDQINDLSSFLATL